jgi:hypothetical protein
MSRFSKAALLEVLRARAEFTRAEWGFREELGWIQVEGKGEEANREYGAFRELLDLVDLIKGGYISYPEKAA